MDFKGAKNYKPGAYETFSDNLGDMLIDLLNGDEKLLNSPEIQALGASNVKAALEWLATADINGDYKDLIANEGWRLMYKRKPPRPEEFLTWDWIGAQSEGLWPNVRHAFEEFCNPDPLNPKRGLALSTSIGWGKANPVDSNIVVDKTILAAVRLYHGVYDAVFLYVGIVVEIEDDGECQLLLVGAQRADEVAQTFGQHRNGAVDEIYTRGTLHRLLVYHRTLLDVVAHVGYVYADLP